MAETQLTERHLQLISRLSKEIVIHDSGQKARVDAILTELETSLRNRNAQLILAELRKASRKIHLDPMDRLQWQAAIGSWGDTLSDSELLHLVRGLNNMGSSPMN